MKKQWLNTSMIVMFGILTALEVILARLCSINVWNLKFGLAFLPVVIAATMFGPLAGALVGALGDFIGAILFPIGAYFPGFTLTAFLTGLVYGLFLKKSQNIPRIICAVLVDQLLLSFLLNTFWLSVWYSTPFLALLPVRLIQTAIMIPVQILLIWVLAKYLPRFKRFVVSVPRKNERS